MRACANQRPCNNDLVITTMFFQYVYWQPSKDDLIKSLPGIRFSALKGRQVQEIFPVFEGNPGWWHHKICSLGTWEPDYQMNLWDLWFFITRGLQGRSGSWDLVRWILRASGRAGPAQRGATHLSHWIWQAGALSKLHWSTDSCSKTKPSPLPSRSKKKNN